MNEVAKGMGDMLCWNLIIWGTFLIHHKCLFPDAFLLVNCLFWNHQITYGWTLEILWEPKFWRKMVPAYSAITFKHIAIESCWTLQTVEILSTERKLGNFWFNFFVGGIIMMVSLWLFGPLHQALGRNCKRERFVSLKKGKILQLQSPWLASLCLWLARYGLKITKQTIVWLINSLKDYLHNLMILGVTFKPQTLERNKPLPLTIMA